MLAHLKKQWKNSNFQIQCFYKGTSGALWWKRKKTQTHRQTQGSTIFDVYLWSFKLSFQFNDFNGECWLSPPPSRTGAWSKSEAKSVRGKTTASTKLPSTTTPKGNSKVIIKIIKICWAVRVDDCQQQTHISYTTTPNPYHGILKMIIESFVNYCAVQVDGC